MTVKNLKITKVLSCILVLSFLLSFAVGCGAGSADDEAVASVNGEKITKEELYNLLVAQYGKGTLENLIVEKVINLEAAKQNISVSDEEIQERLKEYYDYYGDEESFNQVLELSGFTLDDLKKDLELNIKIEKLMEPTITISEEEKKAYFEENKDDFAQEKQVKASHILVDSEEKAKEIKEKLNQGEDFAELAKEYSTDTATKDNGGDLGFFAAGEMSQEFEDAAFGMKEGEISNPVKDEDGYHIIKVVEIKEAKEANYEDSKEEITKLLLRQKAKEKFSNWYEELAANYKIENYLEAK